MKFHKNVKIMPFLSKTILTNFLFLLNYPILAVLVTWINLELPDFLPKSFIT